VSSRGGGRNRNAETRYLRVEGQGEADGRAVLARGLVGVDGGRNQQLDALVDLLRQRQAQAALRVVASFKDGIARKTVLRTELE